MTRFIILCTKFIVALIVALLFTSCRYSLNISGIDGNGNVKTEKRTVTSSFTKIEAKRGVEVIIQQDSNVDIEVEADENLLSHILTTVENGILIITTDENIDNYDALTIRVKLPTIESLEASSGANITNNNVLLGKQLSITSSSGSEIEVNTEYEAITADASSGSNQTLTGKTLKLNASTSSGSQINADNLLSNDVIANASSGSSLDINSLVSLKASASSGAEIDYRGKAKTVKIDETSGGSISKID